ncbi:PEP-CTERM sorting domain-containing protein [Pseudoduganella sp. FT55W]|uniref:PEP-CTERM sorting domain-containing protein n=1 Tax=Duganella rivi TaxID=2666083 RepID=A0A7X4K9N4_9BURK|nr:FxDxF family PEP-CTERM protein [Duganella rivi]MYM65260.1 PEP-CTERM sorting domain-containing protein [Duganella rivi]
MKLKSIVAGAVLAAASFGAMADDQSIALNTTNLITFDSVGTTLADGDDVLSFTGLGAGVYNIYITLSSQNVKWGSSVLSGGSSSVVGTISGGKLQFLDFDYTGSGPFSLSLVGIKTPGYTGTKFGYSGEISVSAVPEPATYGMLLGGLALVGAVARRKAKKAA